MTIQLDNIKLDSGTTLENFRFYNDEPEWGHIIVNFEIDEDKYEVFLQLPETPDSRHTITRNKEYLYADEEHTAATETEIEFDNDILETCVEAIKNHFGDYYQSYICTGLIPKAENYLNTFEDYYVVESIDVNFVLCLDEELTGYNIIRAKKIADLSSTDSADAENEAMQLITQ